MRDILSISDTSEAWSDPASAGSDLMRAVAHGDRAAFASLYDLIGATVFARCLGRTGDRGHAETASRNTFVEIWRTAARYQPRRSTILTWAFDIADRHVTGQQGPAPVADAKARH